jgi:ATP-dependent Clp protease ATP-binding subunit ClpA
MFERFTDGARQVVVLAHEEARELDHNYIGTEHVLLGLIHEGQGTAARALESLGVTLPSARKQVEEIIGRGKHTPSGPIPFTPRSKKVLELSLREALQLGDNYIGTEHILLGLLREGDGAAVQVLVRMRVDLNRVRQTVIGFKRDPGRAVRIASKLPEGVELPREASPPRELWLNTMLNQLGRIADRLDAIERHLGMNTAANQPGTEPEASGGAEAGSAPSGEPEAPGGAEGQPEGE